MRTRRSWRLTRLLSVGSLLGGLAACSGSSPHQSSLRTVDDLVAWMASHRDHVGLVVLPDDGGIPAISLNADALFPLASTKKVLILGAYATAVAAGALDPTQPVALSAVERWYWPGTDGGAHSTAVDEWRGIGLIQHSRVPLEAVAKAMIRWSDNAAADYVLQRAGGPAAVARFAASLGMVRQQPVFEVLGEFAAWSTEAEPWRRAGPTGRAALAGDAAARLHPPQFPSLPAVAVQRQLSRTDSAGTPAEWARLMHEIALGPTLSASVRATMESVLNWPRQVFPQVAAQFADFATKGGSLPGVITEASHIRAVSRSGVSIAIFFRDLPSEIDAELGRTFLHQELERRLATDPSFVSKVKLALPG